MRIGFRDRPIQPLSHLTVSLFYLVSITYGHCHDAIFSARWPNVWRVRGDFQAVLRAMQRSADRQKMLRLRLVMLDFRGLKTLEGGIFVHGEEKTGRQSGRS